MQKNKIGFTVGGGGKWTFFFITGHILEEMESLTLRGESGKYRLGPATIRILQVINGHRIKQKHICSDPSK